MTSNITQYARRFSPALLAAVAAVAAASLAAAPARVAPAAAGALPIQLKGCKPGQIKTSGGKKYVCDKYGHWIHVLTIAAGGVVAATGVQITGTLPAGTLTRTGTAPAGFKVREANGGGTATTCGLGSKPGDYMEERSYTFINGRRTGFTTTTYVCGEDGNWHQVAQLRSGTGIVGVSGTITVQAVRP
jgi:hypothetical protein